MSTQITVKTQKRQDQRFRYGQVFDYGKITFEMYRNPYAKTIVNLTNKAMAPRFDLMGEDDEILPWSDDFWNSGFVPIHKEYRIKGTKYAAGYGKVLFAFFKHPDKPIPILRAFQPKDYDVAYTEQGDIEEIEEAREQIGGTKASTLYHHMKDKKGVKATLKEGRFLEVIPIAAETIGEGISELQGPWDTLYSLRTLSANATYFVVRVGGGLKVIRIPEAKLDDPKFMSRLEDMLQSIDSANSTVTLPIINGLGTEQPNFDIVSGTQIDFLAVRDLLLGDLSVETDYPREAWLGSEMSYGSQALNQSQVMRIYEDKQELWEDTTRWIVDTYIDFMNENIPSTGDDETSTKWNKDEIHSIKYRKRVEANEKDEMEVIKTKSDILTGLLGANVTLESALVFLKLDELEIDTEAIERNKKLTDGLMGPDTEEEPEEPEKIEA